MRFEFPIVTFYGDDPEDCEITTKEAILTPREIRHAPYEATLYALDEIFELVVDHTSKGMMLCVPNKGFGCFIDTPWGCDDNHHVILHSSDILDFEDAEAIVSALTILYKLVKEQK